MWGMRDERNVRPPPFVSIAGLMQDHIAAEPIEQARNRGWMIRIALLQPGSL
jgi:hypothetical protein